MLRICLVEDEEYALKSLHQKIVALDGSYEVVGTAYNGVDALDVIAKQCPDVVITDIRMPDMDGISLIEHISTHFTNMITVIISGYQEFEYAQKGIQFGVEDYLLKPVVPNDLRDCLEKCSKKIDTIRSKMHIDDFSEIPPVRWKNTEYFLIYMIFGNTVSNPESIIHPDGFYIASEDIEQRFQNMVVTQGRAHCFFGICSNEKVVIAPKNNAKENVFLQKLQKLAAYLEGDYGCSVTISFKTMEKTKRVDVQIYRIRRIAIQSVLPGINNIVTEPSKNEHATQNMNDYIEYMALCISQAQFDSLNAKIQSLFAEWNEYRYPLCAMENDLIYITNSLKHTLPATENFEQTIAYYIENVISISSTYTDLANQFYQLIVELFCVTGGACGKTLSSAQLVERIDQYFRSNLSKNLTLPMLCSEMNYSKVHLCRIFRKQRNTTPIDYFIQLKIERAKMLVEECPSMPIKDIASSLGFNDVYYFSKVFKRITGQPPRAAREQAQSTASDAKKRSREPTHNRPE